MKIMKISLCFFLLLSAVTHAGSFDDKHALANISSVKIVCDVNVSDGNLLLRRLKLIDTTYTQLLDADIGVTVVIAFRGGASRFVTKNEKYVKSTQVETKKEIQGWIKQFSENGFRLEQCAIAARAWKVDPADVMPQIKVVQNGYISLVAYQNKGYAFLPMD